VRFPIIYADPAWRYKQQGNGAAAKHYPTLTTRDICALPVGALAADDALLFLWATFPNERDAHRVIDAWGFTYKTAAFVWVKLAKNGRPMFGTGSYTRANAEVCLLATRGQHAARLVRNHSVSQIVLAPRMRHSAKPPIVRDRIVRLCGDVPRVELFARERVTGWHAWGNEVRCDIDLRAA
jgi:N6-adenosine-specific RNA methylase IME4